jgi:hypothetical protein
MREEGDQRESKGPERVEKGEGPKGKVYVEKKIFVRKWQKFTM